MKIWVIGTLDTKCVEVGFIANQIRTAGHEAIIIDPGSSGVPGMRADVTRQNVAEAGGESYDDLLNRNEKSNSQAVMRSGLSKIVVNEYEQGNLDAVIAVGGGQGTAAATAAMRLLPFGVPKVMVSTVACGKTPFGPYVGTSDMTMIHSVADIAGLNFITRKVISQATSAVIAMAGVVGEGVRSDKPLVAVTQTGVTTPGTMVVKTELEDNGFEVVVFHGNGVGGEAMEDFIRQGTIKGVIDYSPHEVADLLFDGLMPAHQGRMSAAGEMGIPQIVVPGCADIRLHEWSEIPEELADRPYVRHTPTHTHFRTTYQEMYAIGSYIAEHLNAGRGCRAAIVPERGFSMMNREGMPLYDAGANMGYVDALKDKLNDDVIFFSRDLHINDAAFAEEVVKTFIQLWQES